MIILTNIREIFTKYLGNNSGNFGEISSMVLGNYHLLTMTFLDLYNEFTRKHFAHFQLS